MKPRIPKFVLKLEQFVTIFVTIMLLLIVTSLKSLQPATDVVSTVISSVLLLFIVMVAVLIATSIFQHSHDEEFDKMMVSLKSLIPTNPYNWLFIEGQVTEIERKVKCNAIWVITYNFYNDTYREHVKDCVKKNMARGIHYTYIVPRTDEILMLEIKFKEIYKEFPSQWKIIMINEKDFRNLTSADVVIFNPDLEDVEDTSVYIELPIKQAQYWVKVSPDTIARYIGRFRDMMERETISD